MFKPLFNNINIFILTFSLFYSCSLFAGGSSGGGGSCGEFCKPCNETIVNLCNGLSESDRDAYGKYYDVIRNKEFSLKNGYDYVLTQFLHTFCMRCTPQNFTYPTMKEIREKDFTKKPNFFNVDFHMFPKDGSYHILSDDIVKSLKQHISCKDDTSRFIVKAAYSEKKNIENFVVPYCKKWVVGISDNYVQSILNNGSVNKLNPNTDIKIFCKDIVSFKHTNILNSDTTDNFNLNSFIKIINGFVCRDGFHRYRYNHLTNRVFKSGEICKVPLRLKVELNRSCGILIKKVYQQSCSSGYRNYKCHYPNLGRFGEVMCGNYHDDSLCSRILIPKEGDKYECYEKGTQEYNELCAKPFITCENSSKACIYVYGEVEKCKVEEKQKCESEKEARINREYKLCETVYNNKENTKRCKSIELTTANRIYNECISSIVNNGWPYNNTICEYSGDSKSRYVMMSKGCYVDASEYSYEKIDDVVKYEVNICQNPIFLDSVRDVKIEKIYDPNLVNQN